jgi:flagellar protein FlgJ
MKNRLNRAEEAIKKEKKAGGNSDAALNRACAEMESLFIYQLFKEMRATIPKSGFISGGRAEEVYRSMLDSELAKELAKRNGLGLAPMLRSQLQKEITKKP